MAYCAYCGKEISDQAVSCPYCGHPNEALRGAGGAYPEQAPVAVGEYAGFWIRFLGLVLDGIIVALVTLPFGRVRRTAGGGVLIFSPARTIVGFAYPWLMIALAKGQTLAMMALNIRITRPGGEPVDLGRSAARAAMAYVSAFALLLGYLWAAWDPEKRTWHDMVADTRVYKTRP